MDTLRETEEINHHGKPRDVGGSDKDESGLTPVEVTSNKVLQKDLRHRREDLEVDARREFYKQIAESKRNNKRLSQFKRVGRVHIPTFLVAFVAVYWAYGLSMMK